MRPARWAAAAAVLFLCLLPPAAAHGAPLDSPDLAPGAQHEQWLDELARLEFGSRHDETLRGAIDVFYDAAAIDGPVFVHIAFRNGTYGAWNGTDPTTFTPQTEFTAPLYGRVVWTNLGETTETVTHASLLPAVATPRESPAPVLVPMLAAGILLAVLRRRT